MILAPVKLTFLNFYAIASASLERCYKKRPVTLITSVEVVLMMPFTVSKRVYFMTTHGREVSHTSAREITTPPEHVDLMDH